MSYTLVDHELEQRLADPSERERWLLLEDHPEFEGHWKVNGFGSNWKYELDEALGHYRAIAPGGFEDFYSEAQKSGYQVAFFNEPMAMLDSYAGLNEAPPVQVNSTLPDTVNGMLPYQVQGFNALKDLDGGVARWDTGTGKTVLASALLKYHIDLEDFDYGFFVVKKNNKVNTVRKLLASVGVEAILVTGTKRQREEAYYDAFEGTRGQVLVMNYETFKTDFVEFEKKRDVNDKPYTKVNGLTVWGSHFFDGRDVLCIWDEMPMKLKNRNSLLYKAICACLYATTVPAVDWAKKRPNTLRQYMLSATPVENNPEDWFNCVRLLNPRIYGTVAEFRAEYVKSYNYFNDHLPEEWYPEGLEKMALKAAHMVHQVDKTDPEVAAVFPKVIEETLYVDWNPEAAKLYSALDKVAKDLAKDDESENMHILSLINLYQMICDAPTMILDTAARREVYEGALEAWEAVGSPWGQEPDPSGSDAALMFLRSLEEKTAHTVGNTNHAKIETLYRLLTEVHPKEKVCLFTRWNAAIMPTMEAILRHWRIPYVRYDGTDAEKQAAQDAFQNDPKIRVFLSSDAGSDSIDLDAGNVVVHYDLPWKWTTFIQRQNRVHRATSEFATVYYYTLLMADSVEDRILQIIMQKQGYHNSLFKPIAGVSTSARLTREDFLFILTGSV